MSRSGGIRDFAPDELRRRRHQAGLTVDKLADLAGVSKQSVTSWENYRTRPTAPHLRGICRTLRCTVRDLRTTTGPVTLKDLRLDVYLRQSDVATATGKAAPTILQIEKGRMPIKPADEPLFCRVYGCSPAELRRAAATSREAWQVELETEMVPG